MKKALVALVAILLLAAPSAASANHALGGVGSPYHWFGTVNERQVTISDGVTIPGNPISYNFSGVVSGWNNAGNGFISLTSTTGTAKITTQRGSYGNNGWLGLAQLWIKGGHFSRVSVKLNDWYAPYFPEYYTADAAQQTLCQEVGHGLGLDHQISKSCMNDQNVPPTNYPKPNRHDSEELRLIYAHLDSGGGKPHKPARERGPFVLDVIPAPLHGHGHGK